MRHTPLFFCAVAAVTAITLATAACDSQDSGDDAAPVVAPGSDTDAAARPRITFSTSGGSVEGPNDVPAGFVDVHVDAGDDAGTHLLIARLNDGVTLDQLLAAPDEEFFNLITVAGGNGFVAAGDAADLTLELEPGNHVAFNINPSDPPPLAEFTVTDGDNQASAPDEKGTIGLGPEMRLTVPEDFDAEGIWRFENRDEVVHEAALVRLAAGATTDDLIDWSHTFEGPPPIDGEFGSIGALGPGRQAWADFSSLDPGDYALVCFIPGEDELPHVTQGMAASVTVGADS